MTYQPESGEAVDAALPLAQLRSAHKRYGTTVALDGLDLEVRRGELLAVLGPNGAGKSTAIALLLGLQRPDAGSALLFGRAPHSLDARRRIGVMMQEVALPPELRVRELVDLTASYYPSPHSVEEALELSGTRSLADRFYSRLSGGQKRQVQFALAICGRPQLLFLDEPTIGLDVPARETMWRTIRRLVAGSCSVVLTTHYLEEAEALADRVAVLAKGRLVASGSVAELRSVVARRQVACLTRVPLEHIRSWAEVETAWRDRERTVILTVEAEVIVRRLLGADEQLSELEVRRAGLAEAFAELTQEVAA